MPINSLELARISRRLRFVSTKLNKIELFLVGQPVSTIRIEDGSIGTAEIDDLSVTNGKFIDLSITDAKITSIDASQFDTGTLSADRIASNSITANELDVTELSAISVDVGTMTSGSLTGLTVTGGTIRTASSGIRAELLSSSNSMRLSSGIMEQIRLDSNGMKLFNSTIQWMTSDFSTFKGSFFRLGTDIIRFQSGNVSEFIIINATSGGDIQFVAANGEVHLNPSGTLYINGTPKSAIVPTSKGFNALYSLESPEVWFFDFSKSKKEIDKLFLETTEEETNVLETDQGEYLVFRKRKGFSKTRFEEKTVEQFNKNNEFWGGI